MKPAIAWRRGYRTVRWSWGDLRREAKRFAAELASRGIAKGDRVLLWGENSGEWVAAFLGCMFAGAVAVPMDVTADAGFAGRVAGHAGVRLAAVGRGLTLPDGGVASLGLEEFFETQRGGSGARATFRPWRRSAAMRSRSFSPPGRRPSRAGWC